MKPHITAALTGALFGAGLVISGMSAPSKVVGFLDFTGEWNPTLMFVMGGALAVFLPAYQLIKRRARPVLGASFDLPTRVGITWQLVVGAVVFGAGWGICGLCPAAAIAALPGLSFNTIGVTVGMAAGIVGMRALRGALAPKAAVTVADF